MLQAVAAFSGGVWVQQKLSDLQLPRLGRAIDEGATFKLSVRVIAASVPGLADAGLLTRERPRVSVVLGGVRKETELGDYHGDGGTFEDEAAGDGLHCPWRFGETLTFATSLNDILLGQGVQLWLRSHSDLRLGPFQINLARTRDVGVCTVDLRNRILPECVYRKSLGLETTSRGDSSSRPSEWETPVLHLALTHVGGSSGSSSSGLVLGQAAGHIALAFSVNTNPKVLLQAAEDATRPLVDRVATPLKELIAEPVRWVVAASQAAGCTSDPNCGGMRVGRQFRAGRQFSDGCYGYGGVSPSRRPRDAALALYGPDLAPEGWISHRGPNGREFWHHKSLGPPPWELPIPSNGLDGPAAAASRVQQPPSAPCMTAAPAANKSVPLTPPTAPPSSACPSSSPPSALSSTASTAPSTAVALPTAAAPFAPSSPSTAPLAPGAPATQAAPGSAVASAGPGVLDRPQGEERQKFGQQPQQGPPVVREEVLAATWHSHHQEMRAFAAASSQCRRASSVEPMPVAAIGPAQVIRGRTVVQCHPPRLAASPPVVPQRILTREVPTLVNGTFIGGPAIGGSFIASGLNGSPAMGSSVLSAGSAAPAGLSRGDGSFIALGNAGHNARGNGSFIAMGNAGRQSRGDGSFVALRSGVGAGGGDGSFIALGGTGRGNGSFVTIGNASRSSGSGSGTGGTMGGISAGTGAPASTSAGAGNGSFIRLSGGPFVPAVTAGSIPAAPMPNGGSFYAGLHHGQLISTQPRLPARSSFAGPDLISRAVPILPLAGGRVGVPFAAEAVNVGSPVMFCRPRQFA